jgi:cell division septation protein DedD
MMLPALPSPPPASLPKLDVPPPPEDVSSAAPVPDGYVIQVALFQTEARARSLVEELTAEGYRAYHTPFHVGDQGIRRQVLIGPYALRADAEADLQRLRRIPGHADAFMSSAGPPPAPPPTPDRR